MENKNDNEGSNIVNFFRDSNVFLTGGTGYMGKVILNKLFSTCQVSCVYLLVRKKDSKSSSTRLQELLKDPVFIHLESKVPNLANRIKLVEGDCSLENLGLSASDEEILCKSTNFVIHCAAALDMLGSCKTSIEINVRGTLHLVNLANKMANLKTFVHVSTMGAFLERDEVDEKLYESPLEYEDLLNLLKLDKVLPIDEQNRKKIIKNKITIYSMTKAAAENIFIREKISVPVVIFRFALAIPCLKEPFPGWWDGVYGPNGIITLPLFGIIPCILYLKNDFVTDFVPADLIVNALIASIQHSYDEFQKSKTLCKEVSPFVYNFSNKCHKNMPNVETCLSFMNREFDLTCHIYSNKLIFMLWIIVVGYIPALIFDFFLFFFGIEFCAFRAFREIVELYFDLGEMNLGSRVNTNNVQNCWKSLNSIDRKLFSFDLDEVVLEEYLPVLANSMREYRRELVENNEMIQLAVFWIPKVKFTFIVLCCAFGLYCVYSISSCLLQLQIP